MQNITVPKKQRLDILIDELFKSVNILIEKHTGIGDTDYVPKNLMRGFEEVIKRSDNDPYLHIVKDNGYELSIKVKCLPRGELRIVYSKDGSTYGIETSKPSNVDTPYFYHTSIEEHGKKPRASSFRDYQRAAAYLSNASRDKVVFPSPERIELLIKVMLDFDLREAEIKGIESDILSEKIYMRKMNTEKASVEGLTRIALLGAKKQRLEEALYGEIDQLAKQ